MQTVRKMKDNVEAYLLEKLLFQFDFERVEKSCVEKTIFEGGYNYTCPWYLKG